MSQRIKLSNIIERNIRKILLFLFHTQFQNLIHQIEQNQTNKDLFIYKQKKRKTFWNFELMWIKKIRFESKITIHRVSIRQIQIQYESTQQQQAK